MKQFLISPPFGNYLHPEECTSVHGSFTWKPRPGLIQHTLRSFRPVQGGWINKIGLRNKGIRSVENWSSDVIYSVAGIDDGDWERMLEFIPAGVNIEVNLGCPNVHEYGISSEIMQAYCLKFTVIAKLSPVPSIHDTAAMCIESGAEYLHCCNTLPTPRGGISGRQLFAVNLPIVEKIANQYPDQVIAGGGIYDADAVRAYWYAGASKFSLSTGCLMPWRFYQIINAILPAA